MASSGSRVLAAQRIEHDRALLAHLPQQPQRQDGTLDQLRSVQAMANRMGCYDAADLLRGLIERSDTSSGTLPV